MTFKQLIPEKGGNLGIQSLLVCVPLPSSSSESDKQVYILYASFRCAMCGGGYAVCGHTKYVLELFNLRLFTKCMLCGLILSLVLI